MSLAGELEKARLRAQAQIEERKRAGEWEGVIKAHVEYQHRPVEWIVEYLGVPEYTLRWSMNEKYGDHVWDGDKDPIIQILEGLARGEDVGVESATGTGKTYVSACIVLWFLACHENALIVTAAPRLDQLLLNVWKEIGELWPRFQRHFPSAELLATGKLRIRPEEKDREKWAATAFTCGVGADEESATKAQGFHAEHMLIITEETPGIHHAIMTAFANTRTDDHNLHLALGNPDHQQDQLHLFCEEEGVKYVRISALDHPNIVSKKKVVPGAIGKKRLSKRTKKYGKGSRLYGSRIRGISPKEAEDALIKWEWCEMAGRKFERDEYREGAQSLGVDVANSEGGDKGAIARWQGACLTEVEDFPCPDANELGTRVVKEARSEGIPGKYVGVDSVGVGAGTVNEAKRLGFTVKQISGARKALPTIDVDEKWGAQQRDEDGNINPAGPTVIDAEVFDNLRSQVWWKMRTDLRKGRIALPPDEELWRDLTTPTFKSQGGKIVVEKKEDIVKRLKRSPNKGDAACYGNFVRPRRPLKTKVADGERETTTRRDYGLEKLLAQREKDQKAERRAFQKSLRSRR